MKKFAIVLMMALLVLGCVFAADGDTGDDSAGKITPETATSGDKFYVTVKIDPVYPVYQIVGYTGTDETTSPSAVSTKTGEYSIVGSLNNEGTKLTVKVAIQHYGVKENNINVVSPTKTDIRYKGTVKVTVTAKELINQDSTVTADPLVVNSEGHVYKSNLPEATAFTAKTDIDNLTVTANAASANTASVTAEYTNGKKVATGTNAVTIANGCVFTWSDIDLLTGGDNYKAEVIVTYESE